jgi:uncharacterized protein (TIGR02996 family)
MSDREAFVSAIAAAPTDDLPRLVFADWLEEHGEPERAEFIRTQIRWHHADPEEKKQLDVRARDLFDEHWRVWFRSFLEVFEIAPMRRGRGFYAGGSTRAGEYTFVYPMGPESAFADVIFARGFVSRFGVNLGRWAGGRSLAEAFRLEPVRELHCQEALHSPRWVGFTDPAFRRVERLSVVQPWAWGVSAPESTALLEDPHLAGVRHFTLHPLAGDQVQSHPLPAPWVTRFVRSSLAYRLTGLTLRHLGDDAVPALCKPGRLHLERLEVGGGLNADSVRRLGGSELGESVRELQLNRADLGNTEAAVLARDEWRKLTSLVLKVNSLTAAVLPALAAAAFTPRLKVLDLSHNPLFDGTDLSGLERLAEALDPERLERLDLTDTGLSHVPDFLTERFGDRVTI